MDKFKIVIKCLLFFVVGAIIFQALTILFVPKWVSKVDPATPRWKEFYEQEEGTIDVLLIGASDVGRGLSPITLWENYGITSFNLGTSNQSMAFSYYVIKEARWKRVSLLRPNLLRSSLKVKRSVIMNWWSLSLHI